MCNCGRRRLPGTPATAPISAASEISALLVKYNGWYDHAEYQGVSGLVYMFGLDRRFGYVDKRDIPGILEYIEDGQKVFEVM